MHLKQNFCRILFVKIITVYIRYNQTTTTTDRWWGKRDDSTKISRHKYHAPHIETTRTHRNTIRIIIAVARFLLFPPVVEIVLEYRKGSSKSLEKSVWVFISFGLTIIRFVRWVFWLCLSMFSFSFFFFWNCFCRGRVLLLFFVFCFNFLIFRWNNSDQNPTNSNNKNRNRQPRMH